MLLLARLLVLLVPMRYWLGSLGTIRENTVSTSEPVSGAKVPKELRAVVSAVERAAVRLPVPVRCLPRAMAVQWMARRRDLASVLIIGIERDGPTPLHAWVEWEAVTVIGRLPGHAFVPLMAIVGRSDEAPVTGCTPAAETASIHTFRKSVR